MTQEQVIVSKELLELFQNGSEEEKRKYADSVIEMIQNVVAQHGLNGFRSIRTMLNNPQTSVDFWYVILQTIKSDYQEHWFRFLMTALSTKII